MGIASRLTLHRTSKSTWASHYNTPANTMTFVHCIFMYIYMCLSVCVRVVTLIRRILRFLRKSPIKFYNFHILDRVRSLIPCAHTPRAHTCHLRILYIPFISSGDFFFFFALLVPQKSRWCISLVGWLLARCQTTTTARRINSSRLSLPSPLAYIRYSCVVCTVICVEIRVCVQQMYITLATAT